MALTRPIAVAVLFLSAGLGFAQTPAPRPKFDAFDVATIKPTAPGEKARYITMRGDDRFVEKSYTLKLLIAAAYDLSPQTISGGPAWVSSDFYDILAVTPGGVRPTRPEQMSMLRALLADRFKLTFHREQKEFSIFQLEVAKTGAKIGSDGGLKPSTAPPDQPPALISMVYPKHVLLPARNATMAEFASLLQRAVLDRPVVDMTGLPGRYDFDLQWAPDETQFGGDLPAPAEATSAPLFTAVQEQLGLRLLATRGPVSALVVDTADRPSAN
jgi:uncharacterized protein (TIGR03435 family)